MADDLADQLAALLTSDLDRVAPVKTVTRPSHGKPINGVLSQEAIAATQERRRLERRRLECRRLERRKLERRRVERRKLERKWKNHGRDSNQRLWLSKQTHQRREAHLRKIIS